MASDIGAPPRPEALVPALRWWLESGVDCPVADAAASWLRPAAEQPAPKPRPVAATAAPPVAAPAPDAALWQSATTLAELAAALAPHPFADGAPESGLMLMGEGPSAEDIRTRRPFSGPAGALLDAMLRAIGRDRSQAYITNLCVRRATAGTPSPGCVARDLALARRHIALARPRVLVLLGGLPAKAITEDPTPVTRQRGRWFDLRIDGHAVPTLVTVNPAYLRRRPLAKRDAWADLRALQQRLAQ